MLLTRFSKKIRSFLLRFDPPKTPYFWEYYNRCNCVIQKIKSLKNNNPTILDVGGATGQLLQKFGLKDVTIVDYLSGADIVGDGKSLPFRDAAFDVVTAIDVFEHIPRKDRLAVAREMQRVARTMVIIIAPQDTPLNVQAEKTVLAHYTQPWLVEHEKNGLVDFNELEQLFTKDKTCKYEIEELDNLMNWVTMSLWGVKDVSDIYQDAIPFENQMAFRRKALSVMVGPEG